MTFNHTAEVFIVMPLLFVGILGAGGLVVMAVERITGWRVPNSRGY